MISEIQCQDDVKGLLCVFSETWGAETLSELVSSLSDTTCLLYKNEQNEVKGYVFYGEDERGFFEITDLGVMKGCRGLGYGKKLVLSVLNFSKDKPVRLSVKEDNEAAKRVYESLGFKYTQTIQNYYGVGHDGLRMEFSPYD